MLNEIQSDAEGRMQKTLVSVSKELGGIRSGKATPALLNTVSVDAYGQKTPLNQVASVTIPDPKSLLVQPWDKNIAGEIVKAIQIADLGLNPQIEGGNMIRIPIPPLSEERRLELVKLCKKFAEDGKVAVRNIRRDANDKLKKAEKDKQISEDEMHKGGESIQAITDKFTQELDNLIILKEQEIMSV